MSDPSDDSRDILLAVAYQLLRHSRATDPRVQRDVSNWLLVYLDATGRADLARSNYETQLLASRQRAEAQ